MATQKRTGGRRRSPERYRVMLTLSREQYEALQEVADAAALPVATYLRQVVVQHLRSRGAS